MTANYVLLEKITVGAAGASSVTFSNIPQTGYTDLVLKMSSRQNLAQIYGVINIQFNGTGGTAYSYKVLQGSGSAASSTGLTSTDSIYGVYSDAGANATANTFSNIEMYIPNYTSSNYKSVSLDQVSENNATAANAILNAGLWSNTSAINSITLSNGGSGASFVQYATFYLYGVAKLGTTPAIVPYATGGDTIMTDGTYWYHTFVSSGTFTPQKAITCDYLVVAGGGGGGQDDNGAGGGAGGLRCTVGATGGGGSLESPLSLGTSAYTVTIGAGGANTASGSNSVFSTITATGGGSGASASQNAASGGSGGGGATAGNRTTAGSGTANQGYAGGTVAGTVAPAYGSGGGGGANAVGVNATSTTGGNGGAGVTTSISGSSVTYAGGGGGGVDTPYAAGAGGTGGGGAGSATGVGTAGTANTGGGGGGGATPGSFGGAGGSGIVIVRYAV
jgi:hypothetical protein